MKQRTPKEVLRYYAENGLPENFCPVPFSTLLFEANGNVCMCRRKGTEFPVGNIHEQTFAEIWNGKKLRDIRREFLSGKVKTCQKEVANDKCNLAADNADLLDFISLSEIQSGPPIRISPNFNGRCNLECKMCHIWKFPNGDYDKIGFWQQLEREILPHLVEIDTFSGEPFIQKDTYRLMDLAYRTNPRIVWSFTTNGNWKLTDFIKNHLDRWSIKTFNLSIDSLSEETYAQIRKKGNLRLALQNLKDLMAYEQSRRERSLSGLGLVLHVVVQRDNWQEIPDFLAFRREHQIKIHLNFLEEPSDLSLGTLSKEEKKEIIQFLMSRVRPDELHMTAILVRRLLIGMDSFYKLDFLQSFKEKSTVLRAVESMHL